MPLFVSISWLFLDVEVAHTSKLGRLIPVEYIDALFDCAEYDVRMVDTH